MKTDIKKLRQEKLRQIYEKMGCLGQQAPKLPQPKSIVK